jgi:adenylate cyclase
VPAAKRIEFRVDINLGDIIIDGGDIFGDGVSVAARLETLAEPGGICISPVVRDEVRDKLAFAFEDMGEQQQVKNIARPMHAHRIRIDATAAAPPATSAEPAPLPLPDKPSIAILPFQNMSGDPEQEYFADGMAEDIITALSKWRWFFVIARDSTFAYKGKSSDVRQVTRELGVRYVLEGSVRKAGNRVRIPAQLIDGATGNHIWADRYDRQVVNIFEVRTTSRGTSSELSSPSSMPPRSSAFRASHRRASMRGGPSYEVYGTLGALQRTTPNRRDNFCGKPLH